MLTTGPLLHVDLNSVSISSIYILQIDEIYSIVGVGTVVGGTILRGTIKEGDSLLIGPSDEGLFYPVTVGSLHRNRLPCRLASAGQSACVSIGKPSCIVRKASEFSLCICEFHPLLV